VYYLMLWFVLVGMVVTLGAIVWLAVWIIDEFFTWFEEGTPMSVFDSNGTNPKPWDSTPAVFENGTSRRVITPELVDPEPITAPDSWSGRRRDWKREAHKSEIAHQRTNQLQERRQQQTILGEMVLFKDYVSTTLVQNQALRERELMQLEREREQRQEEAVRHHYAMEELYHLAPVRLQQKREAEAAQHR
jgi:hypothetical protein